MNWDTTKLNTRSEDFSSSPLTIEKIKKTTLLTNKGNEKCYLVEVKENIVYRNLETGEDDSKKELYTFEITYKGKDQASGANDAFYYLVYHFGKKSDTKIPFRGYRLDGDLVNRIFFLSDASDFSNQQNQDINKIIQEEKKRWDETGYTNEKDLISDNKKIVDSKWEALSKDANGKEWSPGLSEKEKEKIKGVSTIEEVKKVQKEITEKRGQDKVGEDRENALIKDPQTGKDWDPKLTEEEKEVIKDPDLDNSGSIQAAANLLSYLRNIRNDKENGGPGELTDWNSAEKVEAIKLFQKAHYDNISPYKMAKENTDEGKAWKVVNSKLNKVAENIYQRYWQLICNVSGHQTLENQIKVLRELKKKVSEVNKKISKYWDLEENQIIDRKEKENVLGSDWEDRLLEKSTVEEIVAEGESLIKNIDDRKKIEENKKKGYEKEIQENIDEAWKFVNDWHLTEEKVNDLLKKLKEIQIVWAASPVPAKYRAVVEKDKPELGDKSLSKTTDRLQARIRGERAIQTIKRELDDLNNDVDARVDQIRDLMAGNTGNNGRDRQITDAELHKILENDKNLNPVYEGVIDWPTYVKRATTRQDLDVRETNINAKIAEIRGLQTNTSNQGTRRKYIPYPLQHFDLERKYNNFDRNLRVMSDEETIDDYENGGIRSINTLRPFRSALSIMLEQGKKLLDKNDNSQEAEEYRQNVLDLLLKLEDYKNSTEISNKPMWLSYGREQSGVEDLIYDLLVRLREQNLTILTKWKDLLKKGKDESAVQFIDSKFAIYRRNNNRANSQDIKNQRYEKEFQDEVSNQSRSGSQEEQRAIVQQNMPPK